MTANRYGVSFWDDENVLDSVIHAQLCEYTKNHWIVHFKRVSFVVCELYLNKAEKSLIKILSSIRTSLVTQWLRIRLPMQETRVRSLVWEDPTWCGATKPVRHNYWACVPQLLKPACLEPVLHNKRSHSNEKPAHRNEEWPPLATTRESPSAAMKT